MINVVVLGILSVLIFVAYWRKKKSLVIMIAALLLGMLMFQQIGIEPYIRFLADKRVADGFEVKSYLEGAADFMEYACRLRWFVLAEAFLLFLISVLCFERKTGR